MSKPNKSTDQKVCCFCGTSEDNELELGKFYEQGDIVTHYYCLLLSSNMEQRGEDDQGILGFLVLDIHKEIRRGKRLTCSYCKKSGATLGCCNTKCKKMFHLPCGLRAGSLHQFFGEFRSYCQNHRPKQKIDERVKKELAESSDVLCYICYDFVNPYDFVSTLWAPCCKKNAWFHRKCVQQLAMSAGYFFKCPLCNNQCQFQRAMKDNGIFIPSQDASWELVPNAFQELLYRHDQCDASICLCPKGRKHTSNNAKWELALCRTCGSQGIHMTCGNLRWANPIWECSECTSILCKSKSDNHSSSITNITHNDSDDSDSDISVGKDSPIHFESVTPVLQSPIKLRPGPQSYKLRQQLLASKALINRHVEESESSSDVTSAGEVTESIEGSTTSKSNSPSSLSGGNESRGSLNFRTPSGETDKVLITIDSDDDVIEIITHETEESNQHNCTIRHEEYIIPQITENELNSDEQCAEEILSQKVTTDYLQMSCSNQTIPNNLDAEEMERLWTPEPECADPGTMMNIKITNITSLSPEFFAKEHDTTDKDKETLVEVNFDDVEILDTDDTICSNQNTSLKRKPENSQTPASMACTPPTTPDKSKKVRGQSFNLSTAATAITSDQNNFTSQTVTSTIFSSTAISDTIFDLPSKNTPASAPSKNREDNDVVYLRRKSDSDFYVTNTGLNSTAENHYRRNIKYNNDNILTDTGTSDNVNGIQPPRCRRSDSGIYITQNMPPITEVTLNKPVENKPPLEIQCTPSNDNVQSLMNKTECNEVMILDNQYNTATLNETINTLNRAPTTIHPNTENCDGGAGTGPAIERRDDGRAVNECGECASPGPNDVRSTPTNFTSSLRGPRYDNVFSHVANNRNACDKPRLIPEYVRLEDLKFRVRDLNSLQMVLYDTFSVNVNLGAAAKNEPSFAEVKRKHIPEKSVEAHSGDCAVTNCRDVSHYAESNSRVNGDLQSVPPMSSNDPHEFSMLVIGNATCNNDDAKENLDPGGTVCSRSVMDNSLLAAPLEKKLKVTNESNCEEDSNHGQSIPSGAALGTISCGFHNERISHVRHDSKPSGCQGKVETSPRYAYETRKATEERNNHELCKQEVDVNNITEFGSNNLNENSSAQNVLKNCKDDDTFDVMESLTSRSNSSYKTVGTKKHFGNNNVISQNLSSDCVSSSTIDTDNSQTGAEEAKNCSAKRKSRNAIADRFRVSINLNKIRDLIDENPALFLKDRGKGERQSRERLHFLHAQGTVGGRLSLRNRKVRKSLKDRTRHHCYKISTLTDEVVQIANCANDSTNNFRDTIATEKYIPKDAVTANNSLSYNQGTRSKRSGKQFEKQCAVDR